MGTEADADSPSHFTYQVVEWEHIPVEASVLLQDGKLNVYASVLNSDYFQLRPQQGALMLQAGAYIGVIPLNEQVTIEVAPRVPLSNLSRVLRIAKQSPAALEQSSRRYEQEPDMYPSLVDLYARALVERIDEIRLRGLAREYQRRQESTSFPRGRILMGETVKSFVSRGISHKVVVSWFQRTVDNPVNRCLKYAIWFLASCRRDLVRSRATHQSRSVRQALNRVYRVFDGVELDLSRSFMNDSVVLGSHQLPSVRSYYRPALDLSLAVIRQRAVSLDRRGGDLRLPSLILNMSTTFEDYLRNVLTERASSDSWVLRVLDGNQKPPRGGQQPLLHTGLDIKASPDIVIASGSGDARKYPLLLEVKYKPSDRPLDRADLNQAISYGISFRCRDVVLVHPRGPATDSSDAGLRQLGAIENIALHEYVYDLGTDDLAEQEALFCAQVRQLAEDARVG